MAFFRIQMNMIEGGHIGETEEGQFFVVPRFGPWGGYPRKLGGLRFGTSTHSVIAAVLENWAAAPEIASVRVKRCEE